MIERLVVLVALLDLFQNSDRWLGIASHALVDVSVTHLGRHLR